MIRPPSLAKPFDLFVTCDPAIIRAPSRPAENCTPEEVEAYKTALAEYATKIRNARETGDWQPVVVEGQVPTKFVMGQVDRNVWRAVMDRAVLPGDSPRHIGQITLNALLFRLAVRNVVGLDAFSRSADSHWDGWVMAPASLVTQLDEIDPSIVGEIGAEIFRRLQTVSPLS
jgi:hypothetical protein